MILEYLLRIPALLIAMTIHEFSHAFISNIQGDPTPKSQGRLSLNPLRHIDPIGLLMLFLVRFGWAKPVMINPMYYKNKKTGELYTAIAGPLSNILLALISLIFLKYLGNTGIIASFFEQLYIYNLVFAVFNIIPIPPLDGSKVLYTFLPYKYSYAIQKYENYGQIILLLLVVTNFISRILNPLLNVVNRFLNSLVLMM